MSIPGAESNPDAMWLLARHRRYSIWRDRRASPERDSAIDSRIRTRPPAVTSQRCLKLHEFAESGTLRPVPRPDAGHRRGAPPGCLDSNCGDHESRGPASLASGSMAPSEPGGRGGGRRFARRTRSGLASEVLDRLDRGRSDEVARLAMAARQGRAEGASEPRQVLCAPDIEFIVAGGADGEEWSMPRGQVEVLVHIDADGIAGIDEIATNGMRTVLSRRAPGLEPA
jgi:hypothetical protein